MKTLLIPIALFISILSFGQSQPVEIGKAKSLGAVISDLSYTVENTDTIYVLTFNDASYHKITVHKVVAFTNLREFKSAIVDCLKARDKRQIKLGNTQAMIGYERQLGVNCIRFVAQDGFVMWTERQLNKMFNL